MSVFQVNHGKPVSTQISSSTCSSREPLGIKWHRFIWVTCASCHPTTLSNHWRKLKPLTPIRKKPPTWPHSSSSTTKLLTEGHCSLYQLSNAINQDENLSFLALAIPVFSGERWLDDRKGSWPVKKTAFATNKYFPLLLWTSDLTWGNSGEIGEISKTREVGRKEWK